MAILSPLVILLFLVVNHNFMRIFSKALGLNRHKILRMSSSSSEKVSPLYHLDPWSMSTINTFTAYLKEESEEDKKLLLRQTDFDPSLPKPSMQFIPRQIKKAHYAYVKPEPVPSPHIVATSSSCAEMLGLDPSELVTEKFLNVFAGNDLLPGFTPFASVYGCHCYGQWFGQLGDGRAMSLGEVRPSSGSRFELQLKGSGRTPFSRQFDGRAVLRSSVREFIASESMHALGVSTTRALSLVGTGMEIRRPWYSATSQGDLRDPSKKTWIGSSGSSSTSKSKQSFSSSVSRGSEGTKFTPDVLLREPGAITCRVAPSFLRFGQMELFAMRKEYEELVQLANYAIFREFPELLPAELRTQVQSQPQTLSVELQDFINTVHTPHLYISLFGKITASCAKLVSEWMRVGYVQGNMNSDNTLLAGRTIDYGPFGMLEKFDPFYQPFTSDGDGKFAFARQPTAMNVNIGVLSQSFEELVKYSAQHHQDPRPSHNNGNGNDDSISASSSSSVDVLTEEQAAAQINAIADKQFEIEFYKNFDDMRRRKLGLGSWRGKSDAALWIELEQLMFLSGCDYTIFFRQLMEAADCTTSEEAFSKIEISFYTPIASAQSVGGRNNDNTGVEVDEESWHRFFDTYLGRIRQDGATRREECREEQRLANPKFIVRNWMSVMAYEEASKGDYTLLHELMQVLSRPYDEQSEEISSKWYSKTPDWARGMPGVSFMS